MIVTISKKCVTGKGTYPTEGEWVTADKLPPKVLAESDTGKAVIRIDHRIFRFGQATNESEDSSSQVSECKQKYRVLASGMVVVCIQEQHEAKLLS